MRPETLHRIRSAAHEELARVPMPRRWWHEALLLAGLNSAVAVACALALSSTGFIGNPASVGVLVAVAVPPALVIILGAVAAVMPGRRAGLLSALVLVGIATVAIVFGGSATADDRPFLGAGVRCLSVEILAATLPTTAVIVVLSRFAYQPLRILVGGLAAGATGVLALHLHCPIGTPSHLVLFHLLPWVAAAAVAVFIRSRVHSGSFAP